VRHEIARRKVQIDAARSTADRHGLVLEGGRIDEDGPGSRCSERRDRAALVAGDGACLVRIRHREALDAEVRPQLGPVEPATARHEHEEVVILAAAHDERAEERGDRDALQLGTVLGAARRLRAHDAVTDPRGRDSSGCRRVSRR
jgi:hypothetical protein